MRNSYDSHDLSGSKERNQTVGGGDYEQTIYENQQKSPTKLKKILEHDQSFQKKMNNCLEHMEKMPSLRTKVFNQLGQMADVWNEQKGNEGIMAGNYTRLQLA